MGTLLQDLRYAARMLRNSPGFTAAVVLMLALGIGANTAIFSVINTVLLRPLPVQAPDRLAEVYISEKSSPYEGIGYPEYAYFRDHNEVFTGLAAYAPPSVVLSYGDESELVHSQIVSGNYFSVLGVNAAVGRTFTSEDDQIAGASGVVVLDYALWRRRFGSDPKIVGETIRLNGHSFTVVGVAPRNFTGATLAAVDLWVPLMMQAQIRPGLDLLNLRNSGWLEVVGRLKPGVSLEQAGANLNFLAHQLKQSYADKYKFVGVNVVSSTALSARFRGPVAGFAGTLMTVVGLVLLIACSNVANLLLARMPVRRREIAIRLALGASRSRLVQQLLTESIVLSALGGALGIMFALWATPILVAFKPANIPIVLDPHLDERLLGFAILLSITTGLLSGLALAVQAAKPDLVPALKGQIHGSGSSLFSLRNLFVVTQVSVCLVVLIGAGLCLRSLQKANAIHPGFEIKNAFAMSFDPKLSGYLKDQGRRFYSDLIERLEGLHGVQSVSLASYLPLGGEHTSARVFVDGHQMVTVDDAIVGSKYFTTMDIPLVQGRDFNQQDNEESSGVAIINQTLARRLWPDQDATGKRLNLFSPKGSSLEVIGVAADGKYRTLGEAPRAFLYLPFNQRYVSTITLVVRTTGDSKRIAHAVRQEIRALDKNLPVLQTETLEEHMEFPLWLARTTGTLLSAFGILALSLALAGIYGVVTYSVSQRTHEIGIRMALGARRNDVLKLVLSQGLLLTLAGVAVGLLGALGLTRFLSSLLYGIGPTDSLTFVTVSLLLTAVAMLAACIPARRAAKVDPMVALRYE